MSKKLEEYVKGHRKEFDLDHPSEELWDKIAFKLDEHQVKKAFKAAGLDRYCRISYCYHGNQFFIYLS